MPREARGELRPLLDGWEARITIQKRNRKAFMLPAMPKPDAEARCTLLAGLAKRLRRAGHVADAPKLLEMAAMASTAERLDGVMRAVDALCAGKTIEVNRTAVPTFQEFGEQWTKGKLHERHPDYVKKKRTAEDDRLRLEAGVYPVVGHVPLNAFTLDHADAVMANLPASLSPSSRRHYAQLMHRVLGLAVYPARLLAVNPLPTGFLPKLGKRKAFPILHPSNDEQQLACRAIPVQWRIFLGWLAREGGRMGEAIDLRWRDLDLKVGTVSIDANKTDAGRPPWALNKGVAAALTRYKELYAPDAEPDDRVFCDEYNRPIDREHMADRVRRFLDTAGLRETRPDLFDKGVNRGRFGTHGYRRTFVTVHLAAGYSEAWCMDRTGHETTSQLKQYRQIARTIAELNLGELTPLDQAIPELGLPQGIPQKSIARVAELADAPDLGSQPRQHEARSHENAAPREPETQPAEPMMGQSEGERGNADAVDAALAVALTHATRAGQWHLVSQLASELEARRRDRANVVSLVSGRAGRRAR